MKKKQEIEDIRQLIRRDEIEKALEKTRHIVSLELLNAVDLISNRYQKWKREKRLGVGDNSVARNSVVNDLLDILTEEENKENAPIKSETESLPFNSNKISSLDNPPKKDISIEDKKIQVFISYSHKDKKYLDDLKRHFKPLLDRVHFWDDTKIEAGQKWNSEIKSQIEKTKIAILLISADFFNSDFITNNELPPLLRAAENAGAKILSIILKPCLWEEYPEINKYQAINNPLKPVSAIDRNSRELVWVDLVRAVKKTINIDV